MTYHDLNIDAVTHLPELFLHQADRLGPKTFLTKKIDGKWQKFSYRQCKIMVLNLAAALIRAGLKSGERVVILSDNSPEWVIADLAILCAGGIPVPHYVTYKADTHRYCLKDAGSVMAFVASKKLLDAFLSAAKTSSLTHIFTDRKLPKKSKTKPILLDWQEAMMTPPAPSEQLEINHRISMLTREDLALLAYTSGTSGMPKGVMLPHRAILHNARGVLQRLTDHLPGFKIGSETFLSFLPLSHCYEHTVAIYLALTIGARVYFAESLDKLLVNINEVRPSLVTTVPRLCETIYGRIQTGLASAKPAQRFLFDLAKRTGQHKHGLPVQFHPWESIIRIPVYHLIRRKIRKRFGGRLRAFVSGGAPLNPDIGRFFQWMGVDILQGYGLTETAPAVSFNMPHNSNPDTVGVPLPNTDVKIAKDGEILIRGELVMKGYWNNPAVTKRVIDKDGYFHTEDIGKFDSEGRLIITERKKNLIVNSGGDNIAPQYVEGVFAAVNEIDQIMVIGDKRPALAALIVPDADWLQKFCRQRKLGKNNSLKILRENPVLRRYFADLIQSINPRLSTIERVRHFDFPDEPFSIDNDMLTPSFKIRRHVVMRKYQKRLDNLYRK